MDSKDVGPHHDDGDIEERQSSTQGHLPRRIRRLDARQPARIGEAVTQLGRFGAVLYNDTYVRTPSKGKWKPEHSKRTRTVPKIVHRIHNLQQLLAQMERFVEGSVILPQLQARR